MQTRRQHSQQRLGTLPDPEAAAFAEEIFHLARSGNAEALAPLLHVGLPPNLCNHHGDSLLMIASYHGHLDAARVLLDYGADAEIRNDLGQTPIAGAAYKGDVDMVRLLLEHGADVEGASPDDGKTALILAAMFNHVEIVELLLAHGADPQACDTGGISAIEAARAMGADDAANRLQMLLQ